MSESVFDQMPNRELEVVLPATAKEARVACDTYLKMLDEIHRRGLDCNISLKLTAMGLDLDPALCLGPWEVAAAETRRVLDAAGSRPGMAFASAPNKTLSRT